MKESKENLGVGWQKGPHFPGEVCMASGQEGNYQSSVEHPTLQGIDSWIIGLLV